MIRTLFIVTSFLILVSCSGPSGQGQTPNAPNKNSTDEERLKQEGIYSENVVFEPTDFVREDRAIRDIIDWRPQGKNYRKASFADPACDAAFLREQVLSNPKGFDSFFAPFALNCVERWLESNSSTMDLIKYHSVEYAAETNRLMKSYILRFSNGKIARGILAIKPGEEKRPMIVAMCGVLCQNGDRLMMSILMQLFDESPFHVLVVNSNTSHEYFEDNSSVGFGGLNGYDTVMRLARYFRNPQNPWYSKISSVHVHGSSLGGHEALFAAIANQKHRELYGEAPIVSFIGMCPVLNFGDTVEVLLGSGLKSAIAKNRLKELSAKVAVNEGYKHGEFERLYKNKNEYMSLLEDIYFKNQVRTQLMFGYERSSWGLPPVQTLGQALVDARFERWSDLIRDPIFLWSSKDDPVVSASVNSDEFVRRYSSWNNLSFILSNKGSHCGTPVTYGWRNTTLVLQSQILKSDEEFVSRIKKYTVELSEKAQRDFRAYARRSPPLNFYFKVKSGAKVAKLTIEYQRTIDPKCKNVEEADIGTCLMSETADIPLEAFPQTIVQNATVGEADGLTRWLNANVELEDENGVSLRRGGKNPVNMIYHEL